MKKVLFATTALVASAGFAAADVAVTGSAEMAIVGGDAITIDGDPTFYSNNDVAFTMSGETDNGLTFGAKIDLDEATKTVNSNEYVWISGAFGSLHMGDTDNAYDKALSELAFGASILDEISSHGGYNGNSGIERAKTILRYDYSFGDFGFSGSIDMDDTGGDDDAYAVGLAYSGDFAGFGLGLGLGYNWADDEDIIGLSVTGDMGNGFKAGINYSAYNLDGSTASDYHFWGVGLGYTMDALTIAANYGEYDYGTGGTDSDGFGVAVDYDLGGGAEVQFGYTDNYDFSDDAGYSLGLSLSF